MTEAKISIDNVLNFLKLEKGYKIIATHYIKTKSNNCLYKLDTDKENLLLKIYQTDNENRLSREFSALSYLPDKGFNEVPRALFADHNHNWAIYTFIGGNKKKSDDLTQQDLTSIVNYINKLHSISLSEENKHLPMAHMACTSLQDYLNNIDVRLQEFKKTVSLENTSPLLKEFNNLFNPEMVIKKALDNILKNTGTENRLKTIPPRDLRLSPVDLGPHNTLFNNDKAFFLDFEKFGWDDPRRLVAEFIHHDQNTNLSTDSKVFFKELYKETCNLPKYLLEDFEIIVGIFELDWLSVILNSVTSKKINSKLLNNANFNLDSYIQDQVKKMTKRIGEINSKN